MRRTHGMSRGPDGKHTPEYKAWIHARRRCTTPHDPAYKHYGGRGIRVCDEWMQSFAKFYDHIGPRPTEQHSLDRIDNDGHYEPGNVRWATKSEQAANQRDRLRKLSKTDVQMLELAPMLYERGFSTRKIADLFAVGKTTIHKIVNGQYESMVQLEEELYTTEQRRRNHIDGQRGYSPVSSENRRTKRTRRKSR